MMLVVLFCDFEDCVLWYAEHAHLFIYFTFHKNCALNVTSLHKSTTCIQVERHLLEGFENEQHSQL